MLLNHGDERSKMKKHAILFLISAILMFKPIATFADNPCGSYYADKTARKNNATFITSLITGAALLAAIVTASSLAKTDPSEYGSIESESNAQESISWGIGLSMVGAELALITAVHTITHNNNDFEETSGALTYANRFETFSALINKYLYKGGGLKNENISDYEFNILEEVADYYSSFIRLSNRVIKKLENCPISKGVYSEQTSFEEAVAATLNEINKEEILCPVDETSKKEKRTLYRSKYIAEMVASKLAEKAGDEKDCI